MHPDDKAHSGIALIIRSCIKYYEIHKYERNFLQTINAMVEAWNGYIIISAVYSPLKHVIKSKQYITFLENLGNLIIVAGGI